MNDVVLVPLLLKLKLYFPSFSSVSIVDFEQVNACCERILKTEIFWWSYINLPVRSAVSM